MSKNGCRASVLRFPLATAIWSRATARDRAAVQESGRAIITGGSSGIGLALGKLLAQRGWRVALLARRAELLDEQVKELAQRYAQVEAQLSRSVHYMKKEDSDPGTTIE